ncbi:phosphotransferase [Glaciihabitans sp. dw_435]|uniref:maltokinase N-terminal cap-like domain-containing protein n=1 Tax=Glaciihabitans sp. dw_435 TaxID=2720081 RepID=UPI001BD6CC13|nr:phosphotransferase [Glaciihabitans sp. dw_435]
MSFDAVIPPTFPGWLASQRWYANKGSEPRLERIGGWQVADDTVRVTTHYFLDRGPSATVLYQVPLTERLTPLLGVEPIGVVDDWSIYDGTHDSAYPSALLKLILGNESVDGASGHRQPGTQDIEVISSKVLSGEQSNTSIICTVTDGPSIIIKVFRALHHGENPDVTLQSVIAAAGSDLVPASIGYVSGTWSDSGRDDGVAVGHLAFAQEFLPGVEDAWRVALSAAESGEDFSERAHALGVATADVHAILATQMPTRVASRDDIDAVLASMRARLTLAMLEVPSLETCREAIEAIYAAASDAPWPNLQRIHGDYHLGQVLAVPDRGWVLLDFEGEPLRPMAERSELDVTLRDVAGMLRSFDYAAGSVALRNGDDTAAAWASAARHAFVDGYIERSGFDVREHRALLDAFEIDKALYEAVYESRNRPGWLEIPATAIRRLSARRAGAR